MNQKTLDELIGDPPRSTLDVESIIVRQRRRQRLRRLAAGGSAAAGVVLVVVLGMSLTGGPQPRGGTLASAPPAASPSAAGLTLRTDTAAGRQRTTDELRAALENAVAAYASGAAWVYMPDVPGEPRTPDGHPKMWVNRDPVSFEGRSGIVAGGRQGGFYLSVRPTACQPGHSCSPVRTCDATIPVCAATRTSAGLNGVRWMEKLPAKDGKQYVFYGVQIVLHGGAYTLTLQAVNYFGGDAGPVTAPVPALTRSQLDAIAAGIADRIVG